MFATEDNVKFDDQYQRKYNSLNARMIELKMRPAKLPLGFVHENADKDSFGNSINHVYLYNGQRFRMIQTSKKSFPRCHYKLYLATGKFVKVTEFNDDNDCSYNWMAIEGNTAFRIDQHWGDGEGAGVNVYVGEWKPPRDLSSVPNDQLKADDFRPASTAPEHVELMKHLSRVCHNEDMEKFLVHVTAWIIDQPSLWLTREPKMAYANDRG